MTAAGRDFQFFRLSNPVHPAGADPRSREVFAFQAEIVPGNRIAVPAAQ